MKKKKTLNNKEEGGKKRGWVWRIAALCFVIVFLGGGSVDRAKSAKDRAEKRMDEKSDIDVDRASAALMRALSRLNVASKS